MKAKTKRVFSVKKFIEWCHKFVGFEKEINESCELWANECDGKEIEIDSDGDHWIKDACYKSNEHWEEEVEYEDKIKRNSNAEF